jgi:cell division septation protein DedD
VKVERNMSNKVRLLAMGVSGLGLLLAQSALADVKAGVDAWNRGDYKRAVAEWRPAAIAGDPLGQFNLAQAYKLGRGVQVDLGQAESWYAKAAAQNLPEAIDNYGLVLFQEGKRDQAASWLEKAATAGEPRAQMVLGTMLYNGDGVTRDWPRAYALVVRASAQGLTQASTVQAQMDQYIPNDVRQQGLTLAQQMETDQQRAPVAVAANDGIATAPPRHIDAPVVTRPATPPSPRLRPVPAEPVRAAAAQGNWRAQLGAFGEPGNARKMWSQVGGRFPGRQPYFVKSGALTRLLVGPFASRAEAERACAAVKPCVPTGS